MWFCFSFRPVFFSFHNAPLCLPSITWFIVDAVVTLLWTEAPEPPCVLSCVGGGGSLSVTVHLQIKFWTTRGSNKLWLPAQIYKTNIPCLQNCTYCVCIERTREELWWCKMKPSLCVMPDRSVFLSLSSLTLLLLCTVQSWQWSSGHTSPTVLDFSCRKNIFWGVVTFSYFCGTAPVGNDQYLFCAPFCLPLSHL